MDKRKRDQIQDKAHKDARRSAGLGNSYTAARHAGVIPHTREMEVYRAAYRTEKKKRSKGN